MLFRPKIGLALGGGGPRGLAHIGVIKVLEKHNIPIDYIAGTSIGSLVGGFYAYSKDIASIEAHIMNKNWLQILSLFADPSLKGGVIEGSRVEQFLEEYLHSATFSTVQIPFQAAAVNIQTSKLAALHEGSLSKAIRASCAIPILFKPVEIDNHLYFDGGLISSVPVQMVKKMGADIVIAVQLNNKYAPQQHINSQSIQEMGELALNIVEENIANEEVKRADFVIKPPVGHISWNYLLQQDKKKEVIDMGEKTALAKIAPIALIVEKNKIGLIVHNWINKIKKLF